MSRLTSATPIVLAALLLGSPTAGATSRHFVPTLADTCAALPKPHMRLRLSMATEGMAVDEQTIIGVVNRIWAAEGLDLEWALPGAPTTGENVDVWIDVRRKRIVGAEASLGSIAFLHGQPRNFIQVSVDATIARVEWNLASKLQLQPASVFHLMFAGGRQFVERSLGYTIAHELGHYVLAQPRHSSAGLMRASYDPVVFDSVRSDVFRLDAKSRARLRERLAATERCRAQSRDAPAGF